MSIEDQYSELHDRYETIQPKMFKEDIVQIEQLFVTWGELYDSNESLHKLYSCMDSIERIISKYEETSSQLH